MLTKGTADNTTPNEIINVLKDKSNIKNMLDKIEKWLEINTARFNRDVGKRHQMPWYKDGKLLAWYMKVIFEFWLIISLIGRLQKDEYNFRLHQRNTISKTWEVIIPFYATLGRSYFKYFGLRYILRKISYKLEQVQRIVKGIGNCVPK